MNRSAPKTKPDTFYQPVKPIFRQFGLRQFLTVILFLCLSFLIFGAKQKDDLYHAHANLIFNELLGKLQIDPNAIHLQFVDGLAYGSVCDSVDGKAVIKIDPLRFSKFSDVVLIASLSHELGHFYYHHKVSKPGVEPEEQADRFCGKMMHMLGFQRVEEIYECLLFTPENGNSIYPSKAERERQMNLGWIEGKPTLIHSYQAYDPLVFWKLRNDSLLVKINDTQCGSDNLDLFAYALYYDPTTFSTFQLLDYGNKHITEGIGRLVSNKTPYCYKRSTDFLGHKNKFSIYKYGRDYKRSQNDAWLNGVPRTRQII
jgi:hypothetical protein